MSDQGGVPFSLPTARSNAPFPRAQRSDPEYKKRGRPLPTLERAFGESVNGGRPGIRLGHAGAEERHQKHRMGSRRLRRDDSYPLLSPLNNRLCLFLLFFPLTSALTSRRTQSGEISHRRARNHDAKGIRYRNEAESEGGARRFEQRGDEIESRTDQEKGEEAMGALRAERARLA